MSTTTTTPAEAEARTVAAQQRAAEARHGRVRAMGRELDVAARILNGEIGGLVLMEDGPAPAWTDFEHLYLNRRALPADVRTPEAVAVWVGAAFHEIGHTIFSPRPGSALFGMLEGLARTTVPRAFDLLNAIEDQRQERAMVGRFAPLRGYFTAVAVRLIIEEGAADSSWPLVTGRTWIPADARAKVRAAWAAEHGEESAAEIARLVGRYQGLADPAETEATEAAEIVMALAKVLGHEAVATPPSGCGADPKGRPGEAVPTDPDSGPATAAEAEADVAPGKGEGEGAEGEEEGEAEAGAEGEGLGEAGAEGEGEETEGEGARATREAGAEGEATEAEEGEGDAKAKGTAPGTGTGGEGTPGETEAKGEGLADALRDALADVLAEEDVAEDVKGYRDAVAPGQDKALARSHSDRTGEARPEAVKARDEIGDALAEIVAMAEAGILRGEAVGRLNVGRAIDPLADPHGIFDRFDPGAMAAVGTEAVVLVDVSGSMGHQAAHLAEAVWAIHHAADRAGVRLSVLGFSWGEPRAIVLPEDPRPVPGVRPISTGGGTDPRLALEAARLAFSRSEAAHKVLVTLSDGSWSNPVASHALVGEIRAMGVATCHTFLGVWPGATPEDVAKVAEDNRHGHEIAMAMADVADLVDVWGEIVRGLMASGLPAH